MFDFDMTDALKLKVRKLLRKDRKKAEIIGKKIREIVACTPSEIEHYKSLRHDLKNYKRVHINTHFVLTFKVDRQANFVLFVDFEHHDKAYWFRFQSSAKPKSI